MSQLMTATTTQLEAELEKKRMTALLCLFGAALATGASSALPTPVLEVPKQLALGAADAGLCLTIYQIYFGDVVTGRDLLALLQEAGLVTVISGAVGYAGVKVLQGMFDEAANLLTLPGFLLSGTITASETLLIGALWMLYCEDRYRPLPPAPPRILRHR